MHVVDYPSQSDLTYPKELVLPATVRGWRAQSSDLPSWDLTQHQVSDLELIMNGAFSPLDGFMCRRDYDSVLERMRLADGNLWPMPITLDVSTEFAGKIATGDDIALRDIEGVVLAVMKIESIWHPDIQAEAERVFGTLRTEHPGVSAFLNRSQSVYLGGPVTCIAFSTHYNFTEFRHTPANLRAQFAARGWDRVVAYQTRNPLHPAGLELALHVARTSNAALLIHPTVSAILPGDIDSATRMRCYQHVMKRLNSKDTLLSVLPLAMRLAGPREALWHGIVQKNYGCTHFVVGPNHAGPGPDHNGVDFYPRYAAQEWVAQHEAEIGIKGVALPEMVYSEDEGRFAPENVVQPTQRVLKISEIDLRRRLGDGAEIPYWFSYPDVVAELRKAFPVKAQQGFTIFFTGLSGSGKSTIARALFARLTEGGDRSVSLLDGDEVRKHLSSELGFSREHRDLNVTRIGYIASEVTKHRGIAICAPIAPYANTRRQVREMITMHGGFFEVHVSTSLAVCEARDRKGLYARARAGLIQQFTGISDPYEVPSRPEIVIDTDECSPLQAVDVIMNCLQKGGYWIDAQVETARAVA